MCIVSTAKQDKKCKQLSKLKHQKSDTTQKASEISESFEEILLIRRYI